LSSSLNAEVKVLKNFTLIDGTGRPPVAESAMIVNDGRITWIGRTAVLKAPAGAETADLTGKFVMPGIINLHGHIGNTVDLTQDGKFYTRKSIEENLHSMFAYGQTPLFINDPFFTRSVSQTTLQLLSNPERQKTNAAVPHFKEFPGFLETAKKNLKKLADAGVKYGFGTDTGPPGRFPGYAEHWELELMVDAGLTPVQALTAATRSGAEFLGAKDLGTLEVSRWADLIVLNANPLTNIKNSRSIHAVYIAGNLVK